MSLKHFNKTQVLFGFFKSKENIIFFIGMFFIFICSFVSVYAANYLYDSAEVSYDNNISGITSDNVQGAIDELYQDANDYSSIREMIYPVGSIYISVEDDTVAKVQERFGGTWEAFGAGRTLVGMGSNGTTNYTQVEKTDGTESQSYTPAGTVGNTTLTAAQSGLREHTHSFTQPTITVDSKTLTGVLGLHAVSSANIISSTSGIVSGTYGNANNYKTPNDLTNHTGAKSYGAFDIIATHNHTAEATGGAVKKVTAANATSAHNHSFTGTEATISNMQPYITVYMYKRVS